MIEMDQLRSGIRQAVRDVRAENPMAGSITNSVTIDFVANAQLAVGGSAAMVYLPDEGECLVGAGGAVYINMGTLLPVYAETLPRTVARPLPHHHVAGSQKSLRQRRFAVTDGKTAGLAQKILPVVLG